MTTTRRELNKARTREALLSAIREVSAREGIDALTVEAVAERAGVSRRTFFNYFAGLEAAIAAATTSSLAAIARTFLARPSAEDPLTAIIRTLDEQPLGEDLVRWIAAVSSAKQETDVPARLSRIWQDHRDWLADLAAQRLGEGTDPLLTLSLAGSVMSAVEAAEWVWLHDIDPTAVSTDDVATFNALIIRALQHIGSGWTDPTASDA